MDNQKRTNNDLTAQSQNIEKDFPLVKKISIYQIEYKDNKYYHIFRCNMFVFACLIVVSVEILTGMNSNISTFALKYPYLTPNSTSGICAVVSKMHKERVCIKSHFNQINTFQNIGIKFK